VLARDYYALPFTTMLPCQSGSAIINRSSSFRVTPMPSSPRRHAIVAHRLPPAAARRRLSALFAISYRRLINDGEEASTL